MGVVGRGERSETAFSSTMMRSLSLMGRLSISQGAFAELQRPPTFKHQANLSPHHFHNYHLQTSDCKRSYIFAQVRLFCKLKLGRIFNMFVSRALHGHRPFNK